MYSVVITLFFKKYCSTKKKRSKANTLEKFNEPSNANSGFSGALTAALDVMAFSNEIDFTGRNRPGSRKISNASHTMSGNEIRFSRYEFSFYCKTAWQRHFPVSLHNNVETSLPTSEDTAIM